MAITIKSSTKVKEGVDLRRKGSPPPAGPPKAEMAIAMRSSTRVKEGAEWNWVEEEIFFWLEKEGNF